MIEHEKVVLTCHTIAFGDASDHYNLEIEVIGGSRTITLRYLLGNDVVFAGGAERDIGAWMVAGGVLDTNAATSLLLGRRLVAGGLDQHEPPVVSVRSAKGHTHTPVEFRKEEWAEAASIVQAAEREADAELAADRSN